MTNRFPGLPGRILLGGAVLAALAAAGYAAAEQQGEGGAAGKPQGQAGQRSRGDELLSQARQRLREHRWIAASIRQQVNLYGQQLIGSGTYLQGPSEKDWLRYELKLRVADEVASLQQICDGRKLWIRRQTQWQAPASLASVDLERARAAMKEREGQEAEGAGAGLRPPSLTSMGWGGLPRLLEGLERAFEFTAVAECTVRGRAMYALRGQWRQEMLCRLLPAQKEAIAGGQAADLSKLPPPLPDHVIVLLAREDLFCYRIEYRRSASDPADKDETLVLVDLYDVQFDRPLDVRLFSFEPGTTPVADETVGFGGG